MASLSIKGSNINRQYLKYNIDFKELKRGKERERERDTAINS